MFLTEILLCWETWDYMAQVLNRLKTSSETLIDSVEEKDVALSQEVKHLFESAFCIFGDAFYLDSSDFSVDDLEVDFERKIWSCDQALNKLGAIRAKAISILTLEDLATLQFSAEFFQMGKDLALAFRSFSEANSESDFIEKLRKYIKGLILLNPPTLYNLKSFIQEGGQAEKLPRLLRQCIDTFGVIEGEASKVADYIANESPLSRIDADVMFYLNQIESIIDYTQRDIDRVLARKDAIELIIDQVDSEQIVVNPESAEGKAIRRIRFPVSDDDWEVVYRPGDTIDVDALDTELRACGYID
jgi:hypothetical protein